MNILETKMKAATKFTRRKLKLKPDLTLKIVKKLENFILTCIHPLDVESHNEYSLCIVYIGEIAVADVNVNRF